MLSPITQDDTQFVRQEMNRQRRLGSMFMDTEEYDYFTVMMDNIGDFSADGVYSMGATDSLNMPLLELVQLLRDVDEFEFLSCQKYYGEKLLDLESSVENTLSFVASLSAVENKRYALFIWEYSVTTDGKRQRRNDHYFLEGYPTYGFNVVILGDEK